MESLDTTSNFIENMLNGFLSDMEEPREALTSSTFPNGALSTDNHTHVPVPIMTRPNRFRNRFDTSCLGFRSESTRTRQEFAEEELEWISNKDAFPALETFVDVPSQHPSSLPKQQSPVSVLENHTTSSYNNNNGNGMLMSCCGNLKAPRRARSKRRLRHRRGDFNQLSCISQANNKNDNFNEKVKVGIRSASIGRKCQHCGIEKTPQWREGPVGPKTLCNACGVRYKSGRLVPEYRPANSPTFLSKLHSNSHRKVMEMRRLKQMMGMMAKHVETV